MTFPSKSLILYGILIFSIVVFSFFSINPDISYLSFIKIKALDRFAISLLYFISVLALTGFYLFFLNYFKEMNLQTLKKSIFIASFLLLSYPAVLSNDIFNYLASAKVLFSYAENPYVVMPIEFIGDPLLKFMQAANKTALYGPIWIALTGLPFFLGFGNFIQTLFLIKLLAFAFYILTALLLWKMTKSIYAVILFSLHPLVLIETLVSSHNDIVMMFLALLAIYLLERNKLFSATLFIIISILIKFATIALVPVFIYCVIKTLKKKKLNWDKIYKISFALMLAVFLLSSLREEIYPWYAIWFLIFLPLIKFSKNQKIIIIAFSVSLLFRYLPFMILGTHFGSTPILKWTITFLPSVLVILYFILKKRWQKI